MSFFIYFNASLCKFFFSCVFLLAAGILHLFERSTLLLFYDFPTANPVGRNLSSTTEKAMKPKALSLFGELP